MRRPRRKLTSQRRLQPQLQCDATLQPKNLSPIAGYRCRRCCCCCLLRLRHICVCVRDKATQNTHELPLHRHAENNNHHQTAAAAAAAPVAAEQQSQRSTATETCAVTARRQRLSGSGSAATASNNQPAAATNRHAASSSGFVALWPQSLIDSERVQLC